MDISGYVTGSAQPKLNQSNMNNLKITLPPLPTQQKIAQILSSLDDKIELNNAINKNLEEIAQTLFKQWFVDFEFPASLASPLFQGGDREGDGYKSSGGEMVESELGEIPKGWRVEELRSFFKFIKGKKPKEIFDKYDKNLKKYLTIDVFNRGSILYANSEKMIEVQKEDISMVMDGASSGDTVI
jgi:type I restriction enzyme S subunit